MDKQMKTPFSLNPSSIQICFNLIHIYILGPYKVHIILERHLYFLSVIDDSRRFTWVYLKKNKSEVGSKLQDFYHYILNHFQKSIKIIL